MSKFFVTWAGKREHAVNLDLVRFMTAHPTNPQTTVITFDSGHVLMIEQPLQARRP